MWFSQTVSDKCYGIMLDAGSSGTRVHVYNWLCREIQTLAYVDIIETSPETKIKPGISKYAENPNQVVDYLNPLILFAQDNVPQQMWPYTPIFLGATAGMRLLPQDQQDQIIAVVRSVLENSGFLFVDKNWARVISGQDEGAYMWMSVNYLLKNLDSSVPSSKTALTIDLGGASTQISFRPTSQLQDKSQEMDIDIPNFNQYDIYSTSYLGYGNDQARNEVLQMSLVDKTINTSCYHNGYSGPWDQDDSITIQGTGDSEQCRQQIRIYLNNNEGDCKYKDYACSINHRYQPSIPENIEIYALSGVSIQADFYGLVDYTLNEFLQNALQFTALTWEQVQENPDYAKNPYVATNYFMSLYCYELLSYGYRIGVDKMIHSPSLISQNVPIWALAGTFYQVSQVDCNYDSPVCSVQKQQFMGMKGEN